MEVVLLWGGCLCVCVFSSFTLLIQNHVFLWNIIIGTYPTKVLHTLNYSWTLNNMRVWDSNPPYSWKFAYNFTAGLCICSSTSTESTNSCTVIRVYFKNLHVCGPVQFKPLLFKGQLQWFFLIYRRIFEINNTTTIKYSHVCICLYLLIIWWVLAALSHLFTSTWKQRREKCLHFFLS